MTLLAVLLIVVGIATGIITITNCAYLCKGVLPHPASTLLFTVGLATISFFSLWIGVGLL